ncbi:MAG: hypothetical protein A4E58_00599 [Syntrophorhabdus sp. PtaB.Bin006]|nr:MAG: hypothetical protein A4E58_00599 [Syntrophorhabdus sp. PtaB.Bin006]
MDRGCRKKTGPGEDKGKRAAPCLCRSRVQGREGRDGVEDGKHGCVRCPSLGFRIANHDGEDACVCKHLCGYYGIQAVIINEGSGKGFIIHKDAGWGDELFPRDGDDLTVASLWRLGRDERDDLGDRVGKPDLQYAHFKGERIGIFPVRAEKGVPVLILPYGPHGGNSFGLIRSGCMVDEVYKEETSLPGDDGGMGRRIDVHPSIDIHLASTCLR